MMSSQILMSMFSFSLIPVILNTLPRYFRSQYDEEDLRIVPKTRSILLHQTLKHTIIAFDSYFLELISILIASFQKFDHCYSLS